MLPHDFAHASPPDPKGALAFCGPCAFFEVWALGGGGDCHKRHSTAERARAGTCADRFVPPRGEGPGFDLSE